MDLIGSGILFTCISLLESGSFWGAAEGGDMRTNLSARQRGHKRTNKLGSTWRATAVPHV